MPVKLSPLSGMRDFPAEVVQKRKYLTGQLERLFALYGYLPLETPAIESVEVLLGQYGEEGEKLVYRLLDSGDPFARLTQEEMKDTGKLSTYVSSKGLRYDLTVPLARYVAAHRHSLVFPFKRSQVAPVWRADRPQKGRYREFYQCDIDIVGSSHLLYDAELLALAHEAMGALGIHGFQLLLNDRRLLSAVAAELNLPAAEKEVCAVLDKRDKIAEEQIWEMLARLGAAPEARRKLSWLFSLGEEAGEEAAGQLAYLQQKIGHHPAAAAAIQDLREILEKAASFSIPAGQIVLCPTLARGMDYYTSTSFELVVPGGGIGSVAGGGRYDRLLERFGVPGLPSVGLSFGLDRLYQIMEDRGLFPAQAGHACQLLFVPLDTLSEKVMLPWMCEARKHGLASEIYPAAAKLKKALAYASSKTIPWVVLQGEDERAQGVCVLRDMGGHVQRTLPFVEAQVHLLEYYKNIKGTQDE